MPFANDAISSCLTSSTPVPPNSLLNSSSYLNAPPPVACIRSVVLSIRLYSLANEMNSSILDDGKLFRYILSPLASST